MALLKTKEWKYGLNSTYWAVDAININWRDKIAYVSVMGYRSEDAKKILNEEPIETISLFYSGDNFKFIKGTNDEATAYLEIKKNAQFADAVDC
jgi:hypothetical protein